MKITEWRKRVEMLNPKQCLHFQFSTDGSPLSACTYINKKPFVTLDLLFQGLFGNIWHVLIFTFYLESSLRWGWHYFPHQLQLTKV